jgi:two-component sensor histidine kinase
MAELIDSATLVLSELMTNAHKHGQVGGRSIGTSFLRMDDGSGVVIEVHDSRTEQPTLVKALDDDECGRGLTIVDAITEHQWGVIARPGPGKVVWAHINALL